jgi:mannose-6-phosphate isomerase-like protein (cupin superfamily)
MTDRNESVEDRGSSMRRSWWFLDTLVVEHATASGCGPVVLEMTLPVGAAPPAHVHREYDDSFYVVEGEMVVVMGGRRERIGAGAWVSTRRGMRHAFRVVGDAPARILAVHETSSFVDLVHELGEPAPTDELPPPGRSPQAVEVLPAFVAHDIEVVGPSMTEDDASR